MLYLNMAYHSTVYDIVSSSCVSRAATGDGTSQRAADDRLVELLPTEVPVAGVVRFLALRERSEVQGAHFYRAHFYSVPPTDFYSVDSAHNPNIREWSEVHMCAAFGSLEREHGLPWSCVRLSIC